MQGCTAHAERCTIAVRAEGLRETWGRGDDEGGVGRGRRRGMRGRRGRRGRERGRSRAGRGTVSRISLAALEDSGLARDDGENTGVGSKFCFNYIA